MVSRLNVVVTGASGFIGNAISNGLNPSIFNVVRIASRIQIPGLLNDLKKNKYDVVIHCAGKLSGDVEELNDANVVLTRKLISSSPKGSNVHFLFMSTGAVYGNTLVYSSSEVDEVNPLDYYSQTKLEAEKEISKCSQSTILRLPSVYGENNQKGLIFNILKAINNQSVFSLENNGIARRTFLNISDLVFVIEELIRLEIFGTFNVSEPKDYSVKEIITQLNLDFINVPSNNILSSMVLDSSRLSKYIDINYSNVIEFIKNTK
jgi:nucleoside-diphosphate-sugar epimerase